MGFQLKRRRTAGLPGPKAVAASSTFLSTILATFMLSVLQQPVKLPVVSSKMNEGAMVRAKSDAETVEDFHHFD
jgi:hypothetical protein